MNNETINLKALLDSEAGGLFIDETFVKNNDFILYELPGSLNIYNVDGTTNKKERSRHMSKQISRLVNRSKRHVYTSPG
jgi:hypothetical protein